MSRDESAVTLSANLVQILCFEICYNRETVDNSNHIDLK